MRNFLFLSLVTLAAMLTPAYAYINPNEVLVVYNSAPQWNTGDRQSKAVADYYCAARNIPEANKCGLYVDSLSESIQSDAFIKYMVNDYDGHIGLKSFLQATFGSDPNNPGTDPIKSIVLCYGLPKTIYGYGRTGSVDSALTLLFNSTEWGTEPIAGGIGISNPYFTENWIQSPDPASRTKPAEFGEFRSTDTGRTVTAPSFTIVRLFDSSHAIAAGTSGVLYRGTLTGGNWQWTPIPDLAKLFISYDASDICVLDSQTAFVSTGNYERIIKTTDKGITWSYVHTGSANNYIYGISFYSSSSGWRVGSWVDRSVSPNVTRYCVKRVSDTVPGANSGLWGNLPSGFVPKSVAAISASEAWISGDGGIYHTTTGDQTSPQWDAVYTSSGVGDIWVKTVGGVRKGWAANTNGEILRTTDGTTWSQLTSPTFSGTADLAVYDDDHVAIAYGSGSFLLWDGNTSTWTTDTSDSATTKSSVAWLGGTDVVAACGIPSVRWKQGTEWQSMTSISPATWKLRYLVCRLDAYEKPLETVTIEGQPYQIPRDVKRLIDRAVNADTVGRAALTSSKWVLDTPHTVDGSNYGNTASVLGNIVGSSNVVYDNTSTYLTNQQDVLGYISSGCYHPNVHQQTTWWRPFNTWEDGAIAWFDNVSGDALTLRSPDFIWDVRKDDPNAESGKAKAYFWPMNTSGVETSTLYSTQWIGLHSASTGALLTYTNDQPVRANFDQQESIIAYAFGQQTARTINVAEIDLSNINWPGGNTYLALHFPDSDPGNPGDIIDKSPTSTAIQDAVSSGITYGFGVGQPLCTELVREGCTATAGNVGEPYCGNTAHGQITLPQYASGRTWAESVWMGIRSLPWMQVAIGDPLMAPFAANPTISFANPSPAENRHVAGAVSFHAVATPYGSGTIQKVEFWIVSGQSRTKIATDTQAPYECTWNTLEMAGGNRVYPDGNYTIEAFADQAGNVVGRATVARAIVVDNASVPTVSIAQPEADDSVVTGSAPAEAEPDGTPTKVEFWLFGVGNPILAGQDTSAPYQCTISSSIAQDDIYDLQAVTYYDSATSTSYSSKRRIVLVNDSTPVTSVSGLGSLTNGTQVCLVNVPVTAGVSSSMSGAFYVGDSNRTTGIRVETTETAIAQGARVTVKGTLRKTGTGVVERHITASKIWNFGSATCPPALGMSNLHVGGQVPADTVGITGGVGLYNTGLLVRVWGKINYVGSDYCYIDDGSNLQDGNALEGPIIVPLDGGDIPTTYPPVKGLRVYCGTLNKPGIGDYVSMTGISSTNIIGSNIVRCVRLRSQNDITYNDSYTRCAKKQYSQQSWDGYFLDINQDSIPVGSKVRMRSAQIEVPYSTYLRVRHYDQPISSKFTNMWLPTYISATTQLSAYQSVTITGTSFTSGSDQWILADCIYLGGGSYGAMSVSPGGGIEAMSLMALDAEGAPEGPERGGGPFRPWPYPTAEEILASESFRLSYNQIGAIGWALSQPDGSVVDLPAEAICGEWHDGRVLGLKEWFEPILNGPRLFLYLDQPIQIDDRDREMATIDVIGGRLVTLSDGRRALVKPEAVYAYTDATGRWMFPFPWPKIAGRSAITDGSDNWPWKLKVAP